MADTITFRPDDDTSRALAVLTRDGTAVSVAVRSALIEAAGRRAGAALRAEAESLAADEEDRAESGRCCGTWRRCVRGDVHRLRAPRDARGHEQRCPRYAVILQSDDLLLSTLSVAPTSTSAQAASFRPEIDVEGRTTQVLAEQTAAVDPSRLGDLVGHLRFEELRQVEAALRLIVAL